MSDPKSTQDSVLQKVVRFGLEQGRSIWRQPYVFSPVLFATAVLISSLGLFNGIRPFFVLYFIVASILSFRLKNLFLGFFLTFLFTLQFLHPNKAYSIEVIKGSEILEKAFSEGYSVGYFFHLPSFFFFFSGIALCRDMVIKRTKLSKPLLKTLAGIFLIWLLFSLEGIYSIDRFSPYLALSIIWLIQYGMMYFVAIGVCYGLAQYRSFRPLFFSTVAVIVGTQFAVSVLQLLKQQGVGLPFEAESLTSFPTGLDENNAVFRVMGTFMFHNQLAFIAGLMASLVLPFGLEKKTLKYVSLGFLALFIVVLTQSRSALLGSMIMLLINMCVYFQQILFVLQRIGKKRLLFYGIVAFALAAFGIIPRMLLSVNAGYQGAGLAIRVRMFKEATEAITANPLVGYGVGTNEYVLHRLFPDGVMTVFPAAVHMAYLQLWLEIGLIGSSIFFLPFFFLLRYCIVLRLKDQPEKFYRVGYIGGLVVALVFWALLPHIGIIEFPFFGCVLGFGAFWYYLSTTRKRGL